MGTTEKMNQASIIIKSGRNGLMGIKTVAKNGNINIITALFAMLLLMYAPSMQAKTVVWEAGEPVEAQVADETEQVNADKAEPVEADAVEMPAIGSHTEFADKEQGEVKKADADSAYIRGDYAAAIQIYEELLQQGEAAEVYYNLGNSYYKSGDIARAILNYERALLLQPDNGDIRANVEIARSKTVDKITPVPEVFFIAWIHSLGDHLGADTWGKWAIVCFILFLVGIGLFFLGKQVRLKKAGLTAAVIFLILVVVCNLFASRQKDKLVNRDRAIVLTPSVTVRSTPSETGTSLFILHEGCKVQIKDNTLSEWKEISLEDGKVGWLPVSSIEII